MESFVDNNPAIPRPKLAALELVALPVWHYAIEWFSIVIYLDITRV
jgi:hypothetical protein